MSASAEGRGAAPAHGSGEPLLRGSDLRKAFGATTALAGASVEVAAGEVLAVMGPSGSGKSTLMHCLAGLLVPDAGRVELEGREVSAMGDVERSALRRSSFGFVFQSSQLVPELTCLENTALPLRLLGVRRRAAEAAAHELLGRLEVDGVADRRSGEVSGGQAQRVAVARALVAGPRVVFADEPTGALDSLNGERVLQLLTTAARQGGAAVVLVTHDARVAAYSDREVVVRDGAVRTTAGAWP